MADIRSAANEAFWVDDANSMASPARLAALGENVKNHCNPWLADRGVNNISLG
jgi:hypothetical protein